MPAPQAKIKVIQGLNTFDGEAAIVTQGVALTIRNSDGSGSTVAVTILDLTGEGGGPLDKSGTHAEGDVLVSGGPTAFATVTMDFQGTMLVRLVVDEGLPTEVADIKAISTKYASHVDAQILNIPLGGDISMLNYGGQSDGYAYIADGWLHALSMASQGQFKVGGGGSSTPSMLTAEHAGTGVNGIGSALLFRAGNDTGISKDAARAVGGLADVTTGGEAGYMAFEVFNAGALTERGRVNNLGVWSLPSATIAGQAGVGGAPVASAQLDVQSTTKGLGVPRMTAVQIAAIASPAEGLLAYDLTGHALNMRTNSAWVPLTGGVPPTRAINTGTGLSGGGDLSADRTLALANTAVAAGSYTYSSITVDAQGRLTSASSGAAPALASTTLTAGAGLTGGGDLSAPRSFAIATQGGVSPGSYTNTSITVDARGIITAISSGAGGGGGYATLKNAGTAIAAQAILDSIGGEIVFTADTGKSDIALAATLLPHTFASGTAATAPVIVDKTGAAQASNIIWENRRGGTAKSKWYFDVSDSTIFQVAGADLVTYSSGLASITGQLKVSLDANSTIPFVINNTHGSAVNVSIIEMQRAGATAVRIGMNGSDRLVLGNPGFGAGDQMLIGWGAEYKPATISANIGQLANVFAFTGNTVTGMLAGALPDGLMDMSRGVTYNTGNVARHDVVQILAPTVGFVGASTVTDMSTLDVRVAARGSNATFTNGWAIRSTGGVRVDQEGYTAGSNTDLRVGVRVNGGSIDVGGRTIDRLSIAENLFGAISAGSAATVKDLASSYIKAPGDNLSVSNLTVNRSHALMMETSIVTDGATVLSAPSPFLTLSSRYWDTSDKRGDVLQRANTINSGSVIGQWEVRHVKNLGTAAVSFVNDDMGNTYLGAVTGTRVPLTSGFGLGGSLVCGNGIEAAHLTGTIWAANGFRGKEHVFKLIGTSGNAVTLNLAAIDDVAAGIKTRLYMKRAGEVTGIRIYSSAAPNLANINAKVKKNGTTDLGAPFIATLVVTTGTFGGSVRDYQADLGGTAGNCAFQSGDYLEVLLTSASTNSAIDIVVVVEITD